jgi:hypothetical protein
MHLTILIQGQHAHGEAAYTHHGVKALFTVRMNHGVLINTKPIILKRLRA